jgi:hypothetical protein
VSTPVNMLRKIAGIIGARPAQELSQPVKKSAQSVAKIVPITFCSEVNKLDYFYSVT